MSKNIDVIDGAVSTHSRPKAAGAEFSALVCSIGFQHTAARRRLELYGKEAYLTQLVSTHSRPKAAGSLLLFGNIIADSFNTQPPEGGWGVFC